MKKRFSKNFCLAAAALTLTAGISVGSAMAYFTTYATASGGAVPETNISRDLCLYRTRREPGARVRTDIITAAR